MAQYVSKPASEETVAIYTEVPKEVQLSNEWYLCLGFTVSI